MISPDSTGIGLRAYLALSRGIPLAAPELLRRRLRQGKEISDRWHEKLGVAGLPRPDGPLIWLHAVGLGEVLALRGLIGAMAEQAPEVEFLVTSTTRGSAEVLGANLPPRTRHQFLPLDAPRYLARFLDHWRPALSVWAEQDLWPGAVVATARRGIPLALVNARMNAEALARRWRWRGLYRDLFARFRLVMAQDEGSAHHLRDLGARDVRLGPSLKAAAPALTCDPHALAEVREALAGRRAVLLASSHHEDEAVLFAALRAQDGPPLVLVAPRDVARGPSVATRAAEHGLTATLRSRGEGPTAPIWIVDTLGEMGLWFRLCPVSLIGGSFGPTEGHNPWEAATLGSAILHGPRVANFAGDYAALHAANAALPVFSETLPLALRLDHAEMSRRALVLASEAQEALVPMAEELLALGGLG